MRKSFSNQPAKYELTDSIFAVDILDSENIAVESLDSAVETLDSTHSKKSTHNNNYKTTNTKTNINTPEESKSVSEKSVKTKAEKFDFKSTLIKNGVSEKTATEFMQVRKAKGGVNTERAFKLLESQRKGIAIIETAELGKSFDCQVRIFSRCHQLAAFFDSLLIDQVCKTCIQNFVDIQCKEVSGYSGIFRKVMDGVAMLQVFLLIFKYNLNFGFYFFFVFKSHGCF